MAQERPVHEVHVGKVKAAIWKNETDNGVRFGVTFTRIYKTDNGWENSMSHWWIVLVSQIGALSQKQQK